MALRELRVSGLTFEEAQEALDRAREYKKRTIPELQEMLRATRKEFLVLLSEYDERFAAEILEAIRERYPNLIKS